MHFLQPRLRLSWSLDIRYSHTCVGNLIPRGYRLNGKQSGKHEDDMALKIKKGKRKVKTDAKSRLSFWAAVSSALLSRWTVKIQDESKARPLALLLGGDHAVDRFALLQLLLHLNHQFDTIDHALHLLHLRGAQTVSIGNVKHTTNGSSVDTTWERERLVINDMLWAIRKKKNIKLKRMWIYADVIVMCWGSSFA